MISVFCLKLKMVKYCGLLVYEHCELTGITVCGPWYFENLSARWKRSNSV